MRPLSQTQTLLFLFCLFSRALFPQASSLQDIQRRAEAGDAKAQNELGVAYRLGDGVPRNKQEAVKWYRKAAMQGYADGLFNLGISYYNGDGGTTNEDIAYAWLLKAQAAGSKEADSAIGQITSNWKRWRFVDSALRIGDWYAKGDELPLDQTQALVWYRKAAEAGDSNGQLKVCAALTFGLGTARIPEDAFRWCERSARQGNADAIFAVAEKYERGIGVPQDFETAAQWYQKIGSSPEAAFRLARLYYAGNLVSKDELTKYAWLWIANNGSIPEASQMFAREFAKLDKKQSRKAQELAARLASSAQLYHVGLSPRPTRSAVK